MAYLQQAFGKKNPNLPFHPAVRAGDFVFVSGQGPWDASGAVVADEARNAVTTLYNEVKRNTAD